MRGLGNLLASNGRGHVADVGRREAQSLERSRVFRWLVRTGFAARGLTYGLIGAFALAIALGAGTMGAAPNQQGALSLIARTAIGRAALIVICAGFLAYALWKLTQGVLGRGPEGGGGPGLRNRVANLGGCVVYLTFFAVAIRILTGSSGSASGQEKHAAAGILGWPGGKFIVGFGGTVLISISAYQLYEALGGRFVRDQKRGRMGALERRVFMLLGYVGLSARALVFGLVGYFLVRTAIDFNPGSGVGLDGALARLHHQPLGPWALGLVAAGLITFATFSLLEARYRRL